ncbi:MAG: carbohydrate ABC transporter permease [Fimbriimonadaceae bacterium]|nr:carbohydrate ABC transporter permease [Fimbriimonadaceae bacterium]
MSLAEKPTDPTPTPSPTDGNLQAAEYRRATKRGQASAFVGRAASLITLFLGVILFLTPLYVMLVIAFKTSREYGTTSMWALPKNPTLENFEQVLSNTQVVFLQLLQNTAVISVLATAGVLLSSAVCAYGFARMEFAGRDRLFLVLLATMMLPGIVTMIPTYVLFSKIGWVDTIKPLVVPAWLGGGAFNIFLLRQFFLGIPRDLDEAAILDGAGHWRIFWQIIMPLSGPALATVGMFAFIYNWKDFMGPLLYLNTPSKMTLEVGLRAYAGFRAEQWPLLMAASVLVMIPIVIIFFIGQRWFVKGIVMTGIK